MSEPANVSTQDDPMKQTADLGQDRPHVVMVVANDLSIDTRVRKSARELAAAGLRVTVLGVSNSVRHEEHAVGAAKVVLLPVTTILRERTHLDPLLPTSKSSRQLQRIKANSDRYFNHQRNVGAQIGRLRRSFYERRGERVRRRSLRAESRQGRATSSARGFVQRVGNRGTRLRESARRRVMQWREAWLRQRLRLVYQAFIRLHRVQQWHLLRIQAGEERRGDWHGIHPELNDYEASFGPELDRIQPDVIHVHDIHLLGIATRAVGRRHVVNNAPVLIYDSHEFVPGLAKETRREVVGWAALEQEHIDRVDRIITASGPMAEAMASHHGLASIPDVVLNVPTPREGVRRSIRQDVGLTEEVPLIVYSGGATPLRQVDTLVNAIGELETAHLVLVTNRDRYTEELEVIADEIGLAGRLHLVPYVDPMDVVGYLESATVGVLPYSSRPMSHQVTLTNKVFEYMHARLPVVVSDCRATAQLVSAHGFGEVFESGNVTALVQALRSVLTNPHRYRSVYSNDPGLLDETFSWKAQRKVLLDVYEEVLGLGLAFGGIDDAYSGLARLDDASTDA